MRKLVQKCVICQRHTCKPLDETSTPLPRERVESLQVEAFRHIGIDYAGPLYYKERRTVFKCYILVINCAQTRAIHLELTRTLNLCDFVMAFTRFAPRRGVPSTVFSDNGKTFVRDTSYSVEVHHTWCSKAWRLL